MILRKKKNMKKIIIAFSLILISSSIYTQTKSGTGFYSVGHDSLLFDGANETSANFQKTDEDCLMQVLHVKGNVTGTVVTKLRAKACGDEYVWVYIREKKLLKEGDMVKAGEPISTENDKDFIVAQLENGENLFFGGERGEIVVKDYCKNPPNVIMTLEAGKLGIDWNPLLPKTLSICTDLGCLRIKGTKFSLEILKEGDVVSNVLKVFVGSVTFGLNMQNKEISKKAEDKAGEMKKLTEDFQSGKISIEEYTKKMQELQSDMNKTTPQSEIIVNAGFESKIVGLEAPTEPVPFDTNENRWWENK